MTRRPTPEITPSGDQIDGKPDDPPSNLVVTGFYTSTLVIFRACYLVQPSDRGEYELPDAIDPLVQSGQTIDAIRMDG